MEIPILEEKKELCVTPVVFKYVCMHLKLYLYCWITAAPQ